MRIAQIAPLAESVPPKLYGGTERVIAWLVDELVELGHDVTLFASGDSFTRAKLHPVCTQGLRLASPRLDALVAQAALLEAVSRCATGFDVIHAHVDWLHLPLLSRLCVPLSPLCTGASIFPASLLWFACSLMFPSCRYRTASAYLSVTSNGVARFITACPQTSIVPATNPDPIWLFWTGDDRSHGLWNAGDSIQVRFCARGD
jgi:glycosyltransferase involved in cell wall biosynthesis